jgi:Tfp pilus assembly protein PilF
MMLSAMLLSALLVPASSAQEPAAPQQPVAAEPAAAAPSGSADEHVQAGLPLFKRKRFAAARSHFEQAVAADPGSAAANFYLAYTIYKITEPKRPFHPDKQRSAELFAKAYELDPTFKPVWRK